MSLFRMKVSRAALLLSTVATPMRLATGQPAQRADTASALPITPVRTLRFTTDEGTWMSLDVSPDGRTILFDLLGDLYTVPIGGGDATRLTSGMAWDYMPRWSPDGSTIAFAMGGGIWLVNADGSQPRLLKDQVGGSYAVIAVRWSPDARKLAVSLEGTAHCPWFCDTAVGTVNADGSGMRVLATAMEAASQFVGASPHGAPIWSPDGGRIAFGRSDCSAGWDPCREQEWLVDAAGGAPQLLLDSATLLAWYGE